MIPEYIITWQEVKMPLSPTNKQNKRSRPTACKLIMVTVFGCYWIHLCRFFYRENFRSQWVLSVRVFWVLCGFHCFVWGGSLDADRFNRQILRILRIGVLLSHNQNTMDASCNKQPSDSTNAKRFGNFENC